MPSIQKKNKKKIKKNIYLISSNWATYFQCFTVLVCHLHLREINGDKG